MTYEQISYNVENHILTLTLNRPEKLHALTATMHDKRSIRTESAVSYPHFAPGGRSVPLSKLASYLCVNFRCGFLRTSTRLLCLSGFLAVLTLSAHAASPAQEKPFHEKLCAFSMRATNAWQPLPHAKNAGLQRVPSSPDPIYYRNGSTTMVVYCAPRFELNFENSVARKVSAVSHSYISFSILANDRIQFQKAPAQWFLFNGSLKLQGTSQQGYMIVADRGDRSLVITLSADANTDPNYSNKFRAAVRLFTLQ